MPHLILEYSANVAAPEHISECFSKLHTVLVESGNAQLHRCKSRAYIAKNFLIGSGDPGHGFVHLTVRPMSGRSSEVKNEIGNRCRDVLVL